MIIRWWYGKNKSAYRRLICQNKRNQGWMRTTFNENTFFWKMRNSDKFIFCLIFTLVRSSDVSDENINKRSRLFVYLPAPKVRGLQQKYNFWLYLKDLNVKLGNQAHQKIQLNVPNWNGTKLENIDTIDAKMSFYLDLEN